MAKTRDKTKLLIGRRLGILLLLGYHPGDVWYWVINMWYKTLEDQIPVDFILYFVCVCGFIFIWTIGLATNGFYLPGMINLYKTILN